MSERPPATPESLLRNMLQEVLLVLELQEGKELVLLPRHWLEGWQRSLITALRLFGQRDS